MKKIKELQKRSQLSEGRNYGVGFTILNKKSSEFETYLPFTACRDYLNDFAYVESTKKEIGNVYGYNHKLINTFDNKRIFYMGVNILNYNNAGNWLNFDESNDVLKNNYKNLEVFLNYVEDHVKLSTIKTKIELDEDVLIIKAPIFWLKSTALISIYTLLIRCFLNIKDFDYSSNIIEQIKNHEPLIMADRMMMKSCVDFMELNDFKSMVKLDYNSLLDTTVKFLIHNFGISNYIKKIKDMKYQLTEDDE